MSFQLGDSDPLIHQFDSTGINEEDEKPIKQVNQYNLVWKIGYGSFAKVYLGVDIHTNKKYAIKRFKIHDLQHLDGGVSQLEREIKTMRAIQHPHILHLHEVLHVVETDVAYLVLDYCNCGSLQHLLDIKATISMPEIKYIFKSIALAVYSLHKSRTVHQDIKPSNILLCSDGRVYLADFGLGHSFQSATMVVGSPAYQAPEALGEGELQPNPPKEDVWSLGITLYQTLYKTLPYTGENVYEIVQNAYHKPLFIPPETMPEITNLLHGMLSISPSERMSIDEVLQSPFFKDTHDINHFNFNVIHPPPIDKYRRIHHIDAISCGPDYKFKRPNLTTEQLLKNVSLLSPIESL